MIPWLSRRRVWIMFLWYLVLKCSLISLLELPVAVGSPEPEGRGHNQQQPSSESSLEDLYHRILDDSEFSSHANIRFNRHSTPVEREVTDGPAHRRDGPRWSDSRTPARVAHSNPKINADSYSRVSSSGVVDSERSILEGLQEAEREEEKEFLPKVAHTERRADFRSSVLRDSQAQEKLSIGEETDDDVTERQHYPVYRRHRRSAQRHRRSVVRQKDVGGQLGQQPTAGDDAPAESTADSTQSPDRIEESSTSHPSSPGPASASSTSAPAAAAAAAAAVAASVTSHGSATPVVDGFNLLDDSVFIATGRPGSGSGRNATTPVDDRRLPALGTDLTLDPNGNLFAGDNFDEQIIFLNGPDLLETSVEQQQQQQQQLTGKVARETPRESPAMDEPQALQLRPIIRGPSEEHVVEDNVVLVYADQHETVRLNCEVDADITSSVWLKDGQVVHVMDKKARTADVRFVKESLGALTISNVMLEDDGVWQCEAENARGFFFNGRPIKLIVLDPPKEPYLLIDSRRLDAGNMFIPVKENSELTLACVSEGGNPKPTLTWEVLLSPGIDRHAQKISSEVLELQEIKKEKDKEPYRRNSGAISEVKLPAVFRVHHNARILCIMEHPTLKVRQNASILLDVQYTPSFAITRTPGFGYPLREGIEVSLKCDVDSNPPSTPVWQKDDGDTPVPQIGDGFLNFSSIRREHSGWYKCTSRHLNFQYSSIGYYLSVRYEPVDVTSEPVEQDPPLSPSSSSSSSASSSSSSSSSSSTGSVLNPASSSGAATGVVPSGGGTSGGGGDQTGTNNFKGGQMEVELGGSVTLQCPQGSLGCWSHLDPVTARLKGLGTGIYTPTGHFSLKDVVYQDAGTYKCVGQSTNNRKKLEVLQTVSIAVKGAPSVSARNTTPVAYPGSPLHLSVEFCANPPAYAARWLHGDRVYTPGNQYGSDVLAYGFIDLPTPFCKEARLTYVHMHEKVPRTFYFIVSSPGGVAEAVFRVNYTLKHKQTSAASSGAGSGTFGSPFSLSSSSSSSSSGTSGGAAASGTNGGYKLNTNTLNTVPGNGLDDDEELMEPEEIHFPSFDRSRAIRSIQLPARLVTSAIRALLPALLVHYSFRYLA